MLAYGHSDLSAALGIHLQLEHPRFKEVVRTIAATCRKYGKLARGSAETEAQIEEYWHLGCQVLNLPGTDTSTYLEGSRPAPAVRMRDSRRLACRHRSVRPEVASVWEPRWPRLVQLGVVIVTSIARPAYL